MAIGEIINSVVKSVLGKHANDPATFPSIDLHFFWDPRNTSGELMPCISTEMFRIREVDVWTVTDVPSVTPAAVGYLGVSQLSRGITLLSVRYSEQPGRI